ncbi:hypothetical protein PoB_005493900 [Plakobranchus ocellatus]|uniref:Uncharacterized protein n=1 Tax=Plakobranchus ocellatus TaxID=259542 RepID=A0AAV4CBH4_9GAST|nr:hypothetical protein PoB_005493900 [Plakobranchus ocellatus]
MCFLFQSPGLKKRDPPNMRRRLVFLTRALQCPLSLIGHLVQKILPRLTLASLPFYFATPRQKLSIQRRLTAKWSEDSLNAETERKREEKSIHATASSKAEMPLQKIKFFQIQRKGRTLFDCFCSCKCESVGCGRYLTFDGVRRRRAKC